MSKRRSAAVSDGDTVGLPAADHFDTYWGDLAHPLDFTQAVADATQVIKRGTLCGFRLTR